MAYVLFKYKICVVDCQSPGEVKTIKLNFFRSFVFLPFLVSLLTASLQPLQIQVSDGLHNSSVLLEIRLTDVNDRDPEFNSSLQYSADVPEVSLSFTVVSSFNSRCSSSSVLYKSSDA